MAGVLCGSADNPTDEDVIPKWLLRAFDVGPGYATVNVREESGSPNAVRKLQHFQVTLDLICPWFPGVGLLECGHATGSVASWSSYSVGVSMPSDEWRRRRLWKISRYSNRALASSRRVRQRCRLSSSV